MLPNNHPYEGFCLKRANYSGYKSGIENPDFLVMKNQNSQIAPLALKIGMELRMDII